MGHSRSIEITGAREHNLENVSIVLPHNRLICFTGVSGSGKSSLAFDTLYAEGKRCYIESLSSYARQFLDRVPKPQVDSITGLAPSISISQKTGTQNPRSTVGTVTEIYDYLRVLFACVATGYCPECGRPIEAQTRAQILDQVELLPDGVTLTILAPKIRAQKGEHRDLFAQMKKQGYLSARVDGTIARLGDDLRLDRQMRHDIDVVVDRIEKKPEARTRLAAAIETGLKLGGNRVIVQVVSDDSQAPPEELFFSSDYACPNCGISFEQPTPQLFSFNSPRGQCPACGGLGDIHTFDESLLIPDPGLSIKQGCFDPFGSWSMMSQFHRVFLQEIAGALARRDGIDASVILETPWEKIPSGYRKELLYGAEKLPVTPKSLASGAAGRSEKNFAGIIPHLLKRYEHLDKNHQAEMEKYMSRVLCKECRGGRINRQARSYRLETASDAECFAEKKSFNLAELAALPVSRLIAFFEQIKLGDNQRYIARQPLKEILSRLGFLRDVGLDYLSIGRSSPTLSGGEMQRIRLAGQIGSSLAGVLYVLDEPSIGLHSRDNHRLIKTLEHLRDLGNTVVVVEHDEETMRSADWLVDFGPGPGALGGDVVASGPPSEVIKQTENSVTARFLSGQDEIPIPKKRRKVGDKKLVVCGAAENNLKGIDVTIPLGGIICVTGVSGSGKSSLVNEILLKALGQKLNGTKAQPGRYERIEGVEHLDKLIAIDQSPIGRTPRSNPVTYTKIFEDIRKLFADLPEAKAKGYSAGRFSFNTNSGRCKSCDGNGSLKLDMGFLADTWVTCPVCNGHRFNAETRSVVFKGMSIDRILDLEVRQAIEVFKNFPRIAPKLQTLADVGLGYMKLGQPSPTLSGGEAQRIKLARELVKRSTGRTLYLLDEPTTGLHFADIKQLLSILNRFADAGNTVLIVEHNLDIIKMADWVIDLGPEGGEEGGWVIAEGTPEEIMRNPKSYTGRALAEHIKNHGKDITPRRSEEPADREDDFSAEAILVRGARQNNLQNISVDIPRFKTTVCCGHSGSGKSSLAMSTVYAEGQRRYVESLSSYARQFLGQMPKADVDRVIGVSPTVAIGQKGVSRAARSTVGTITEIQDYLRVLFTRLGTPYCPDCDIPIGTQSVDEIVARILTRAGDSPILILAPIGSEALTDANKLWKKLLGDGFLRVRIDGKIFRLDAVEPIDRHRQHKIEVVVDRILPASFPNERKLRSRVAGSVEHALEIGRGEIITLDGREDKSDTPEETRYSSHRTCPRCGKSFDRLTPHHFSFNSPLGWCEHCKGFGVEIGMNSLYCLRDPKKTLAEGALLFVPEDHRNLNYKMFEAFCLACGIPMDVPYDQLDARYRRWIFRGVPQRLFEFRPDENLPPITFSYKGIFPAVEEAQRLVPTFRRRLDFETEEIECPDCLGSRLNDRASAVRFHDVTLDRIGRMPLGQLLKFLEGMRLTEIEEKAAGNILASIRQRVGFLVEIGLDYLTLNRGASTLSGGEAQRIRLASQIGSGLTGVLYILDEPTIGLHPRDNARLIGAIEKLRSLGNTILMVEHDRQVIESADHLLDFGPEAGPRGGWIVAQGTPEELKRSGESVTGPYLSGKKAIAIPINRRILP
ncbi:MAG: excinuclease ABC subunit UvrA [Thermoguttaceae bacterium]|nr:excinuclease ABC subunit UvrA [Thermoguttaceae bacterium]